jgi:anti-anti-sigma regulatory factor
MMNVIVSYEHGQVPVTILHIQGSVDGESYKNLIAKAQEVHRAGTRDLLLDLSDVPFISSAGMVALHTITKLMKNLPMPDPNEGWQAFRSIERDHDDGTQAHVKLLNPQPKVENVLETVGFKKFFEIYTNLETAIASFQA